MRALHLRVSQDGSPRYAWRYFPAEEPPSYSPSSAHILLPEQAYDSSSLVSKYSGFVALMSAVLEDAMECFLKQFASTKRRDLRLAREAEEWFLSDSDAWPFSFTNICIVLSIDPDYIRTGLKRRRQSTSPPPKWNTRRRVRSHQIHLAS
jgi:hypothetical protein